MFYLLGKKKFKTTSEAGVGQGASHPSPYCTCRVKMAKLLQKNHMYIISI